MQINVQVSVKGGRHIYFVLRNNWGNNEKDF